MSGSTPTDHLTLTVDPADATALIGTATRVVRDDFAGPGGWRTGIADLLTDAGLVEVALEWDAAAVATQLANGHTRALRADVAAYPLEPFLGVTAGYIASPPCQKFAQAGDGAGVEHLALLCACVRGILLGRLTYAEAMARLEAAGALDDKDGNPDPRVGLILIPARVIRGLLDHDDQGPTNLEWVALEQVKTAAPVFRVYAETLRELGFSAVCAVLNAADYGVPQARERVYVLASRVRRVTVPAPTHAADDEPLTLFGPGRLPWRTMADALGWSAADVADRVAAGTPEQAAWVHTRPSMTLVGSFAPEVVAAPGYRKAGDPPRQRTPGSVRITEVEGAVLQGFPAGYAWQGTGKGKRWEQIGNVVCPPVARRVVAEVLGVDAAPLPWHAYAFPDRDAA